MIDYLLHTFGRALARYLAKPVRSYAPVATIAPVQLSAILVPGDVLLVEGHSRLSSVIKYLTQSTWSHAAFYIGSNARECTGSDTAMLIEADVQDGVRLVPLSAYTDFHTRVCRAENLAADDLEHMIASALARVGQSYDLKNVFDLARYLLPTPPVPTRWRRRMIGFGSGDPTRAICSTLIAQLFISIRYPILPEIHHVPLDHTGGITHFQDMLHIRSSSLYVPRDFDISPYFRVIKPEMPSDFDYRQLHWDAD